MDISRFWRGKLESIISSKKLIVPEVPQTSGVSSEESAQYNVMYGKRNVLFRLNSKKGRSFLTDDCMFFIVYLLLQDVILENNS